MYNIDLANDTKKYWNFMKRKKREYKRKKLEGSSSYILDQIPSEFLAESEGNCFFNKASHLVNVFECNNFSRIHFRPPGQFLLSKIRYRSVLYRCDAYRTVLTITAYIVLYVECYLLPYHSPIIGLQ